MEVLSNIPDQVSIQVVIHSYSSRMLVFSGAFWYALPELTQFTQLYSYMHTQINRGRCPLSKFPTEFYGHTYKLIPLK